MPRARRPQNSQVAENLLKERIKSFGFRIWSDDPKTPAAQGAGADFAVVGEAKLKKLSARLAASGITIDKYVLTSWTVKCIDRQTGEEIYYNNKLPTATGSWATEEQALAAIGGKIADEFSRDFFMQHFNASGQKMTLKLDGLPDKAAEEAIARELLGLQPVISVARRAGGASAMYDLQLSGGSGPLTDLVAERHSQTAQRQARTGVLQSGRHERRAGGGHVRQGLQRQSGARQA